MSLIVEIKVVPASGRSAWKLENSGILKRYLKNPPEKGLANRELIDVLAKALQLPRQEIIIISGQTSRIKRVKINTALTYEQLLSRLGIERQMKVF